MGELGKKCLEDGGKFLWRIWSFWSVKTKNICQAATGIGMHGPIGVLQELFIGQIGRERRVIIGSFCLFGSRKSIGENQESGHQFFSGDGVGDGGDDGGVEMSGGLGSFDHGGDF